MSGAPNPLTPEVLADAIALLRGVADEARFDRRRGVELWCDEPLAEGLRELFRTVALAKRNARSSGGVSHATPLAPARRGKSSATTPVDGDAGIRKVFAAIEGASSTPEKPRGPKTANPPNAASSPSQPQPSGATSRAAGSKTPEARTPAAGTPTAGTPAAGTSASPPAKSPPSGLGGKVETGVSRPQPASPKGKAWGPPPIASGRKSTWESDLAAIETQAKECRACSLCETRRSVVFGVGSAHVPLLFIGEAPGADEDRQGIPFVGRAGQLLTKIISAIGLDREEVYIANILKCRPPGNRNPAPDEIARCTPFLTRQIEVLRPKAICTLGLFASQFILDSTLSMGRMRGQSYTYEGIPVIPTYHPAALLRNPDLKAKVWDDVRVLRGVLDETE